MFQFNSSYIHVSIQMLERSKRTIDNQSFMMILQCLMIERIYSCLGYYR